MGHGDTLSPNITRQVDIETLRTFHRSNATLSQPNEKFLDNMMAMIQSR